MTTYQFGTFEISVQLKLPICYISILPIDQPFLYELEITPDKIKGQLIKTVEKLHEILVDILLSHNKDFMKMVITLSDDKQSIKMAINLNYPYFSEEFIFHLPKSENNINLLKIYTNHEKIIREVQEEIKQLKYKLKFEEKYEYIPSQTLNKTLEGKFEELLILNSSQCHIMPISQNQFFARQEYPCSAIYANNYVFYINNSDQAEYPVTYKFKYITKMVVSQINFSTNLNFLRYNTNLVQLCLIKNNIEDISILTKFEQLVTLFIFECKSIRDFSPIDGIKNLKILCLSSDINSGLLSKNKKYTVIFVNKPARYCSF